MTLLISILSVSCSAPLVLSNAHIADQSNSIYLEGTKVTFQCNNGSQALLTTCHANGDWIPPPDELDCNPKSGRHSYIPIVESEVINLSDAIGTTKVLG